MTSRYSRIHAIWRCVGSVALVVALMLTGLSGHGAAQPALHHAGLVVQHGDGTLSWAMVAFPEDHISGVDLLERSGLETLTVPFGALGAAVCQIEREGCPATECQRTLCQTSAHAAFWRFYEQGPSGGQAWVSSPLGASATKIRDGQVIAWSWGNGAVDLPFIDLADVAGRLGLDAGALAGMGVAGTPTARFVSGYVPRADPTERWTAALPGLAALLATTLLGGVMLLLRRRRRWLTL